MSPLSNDLKQVVHKIPRPNLYYFSQPKECLNMTFNNTQFIIKHTTHSRRYESCFWE